MEPNHLVKSLPYQSNLEMTMTEKIITSLVVIVVVATIACVLIIHALRAIWGGK